MCQVTAGSMVGKFILRIAPCPKKCCGTSNRCVIVFKPEQYALVLKAMATRVSELSPEYPKAVADAGMDISLLLPHPEEKSNETS